MPGVLDQPSERTEDEAQHGVDTVTLKMLSSPTSTCSPSGHHTAPSTSQTLLVTREHNEEQPALGLHTAIPSPSAPEEPRAIILCCQSC